MIGQARRASAVISYNGKDISADIAPYLKSLSYRDNLSGEADDLQIVLEDRAGLWQSSWLPEKGASLHVTLKVSQWASLTGEKTFPLGAFEIDEISVSGYPSEVQIKAVSVPDGNTLRGEEHTRSWEKAELKTIAQDIASGAEMELFYDTEDNPVIDRAEQTEQSDLSFLLALCRDYGLALKISDGKIIIFDEAKYEAEEAALTFVKPGTVYTEDSEGKMTFLPHLLSYSISSKIRDVFAACHVKYQDSSTKEIIETTFTAPGKTGKTLQVKEQVANTAEAERLAKKRLREKNKDEITASISLPGSFHIAAGMTAMMQGFGAFDGKYIITEAEHSMSGGYTVRVGLRRCLNGY